VQADFDHGSGHPPDHAPDEMRGFHPEQQQAVLFLKRRRLYLNDRGLVRPGRILGAEQNEVVPSWKKFHRLSHQSQV
jgi:hypothetical protein